MSASSRRGNTQRGESTTIAVTSGDPAGIGPEIVVRLFSAYTPKRSVAVLIGASKVFEPWLEKTGFDCPALESSEALEHKTAGVFILPTGVADDFPLSRDSAGGGRHAGRAIDIACELANNCSVAGIVTAPISKKSLNLANFAFPGHTEMLAHNLKAPFCQMMMVYGNLRVVPLTRHLPLGAVSESITRDKIIACVRETRNALVKDFDIPRPRIAVAGLNPHSGDAGVFGDEEAETIVPALETLREEGVDVTGPMPGDALFPLAYADHREAGWENPKRGRFDAYIAMYHDQGLIPFKMLAQRRGVNVTVGLPVVRTSVDHGVAYDIAGKGIAETESLHRAYKLAEQMCLHRARATGGKT